MAGEPVPAPQAKGKVCFALNHSASGGIGELWIDLSRALGAAGYETELLALWPLPEVPQAARPGTVWRHVLEAKPARPAALVRLVTRLAGIIRASRPDWIVTAMPAANTLLPIAVKLSGTRAKVITSHHTPSDQMNAVLRRIDRHVATLGSVSHVVSVSQSVAETFGVGSRAYGAKKVTIHNALPPDIEDLLERLARTVPRGRARRTKVVSLGRLAYQKNHEVLVRAVALVEDLSVDIVGNGPDEADLKRLASELGVADRVVFHGHLARDKALPILAEGDIFVQMSRFEGHSLALIEAAKLGLPLVVSRIPVQLEGITDASGAVCGIALDPDDHVGLAEEIGRLVQDDAHYAQASAMAGRLARGITFQKMLDGYARLFR